MLALIPRKRQENALYNTKKNSTKAISPARIEKILLFFQVHKNIKSINNTNKGPTLRYLTLLNRDIKVERTLERYRKFTY